MNFSTFSTSFQFGLISLLLTIASSNRSRTTEAPSDQNVFSALQLKTQEQGVIRIHICLADVLPQVLEHSFHTGDPLFNSLPVHIQAKVFGNRNFLAPSFFKWKMKVWKIFHKYIIYLPCKNKMWQICSFYDIFHTRLLSIKGLFYKLCHIKRRTGP